MAFRRNPMEFLIPTSRPDLRCDNGYDIIRNGNNIKSIRFILIQFLSSVLLNKILLYVVEKE